MLRKAAPAAILALALILAGCASNPAQSAPAGRKTIVVTYSILGAVVKDLVGEQAEVVVPMPNGQDPHEWEPSARDIETINHADLVVENGLGLEGGMEKTLAQARAQGVPFFTASEHITIRHVGAGEGVGDDPDQAVGAQDPHLWMDPAAMQAIVDALAAQLKAQAGIDVSGRAKDLDGRLDALDAQIAAQVSSLPEANRTLVTGHESMGYFAQRYHFRLIGALTPGLTSDAETSAAQLAALKQAVTANHVRAIFTELGTPPAVADAMGRETGAKVVPLTTHSLPGDGSYFTFLRDIASTIVTALK